jgi:hypothetical protein
MSLKTQELLMVDYHGTFIFSSGGVVTQKQWSFSAIDISKAILKLKITNVPSSALGGSGMAIDYYDGATMSWQELGSVEKWWGGDAYKEVDVTSICRANPQFKWRMRVWTPFLVYYSCMGCKAYLYLEYTLGEPEAQGVSSVNPFGDTTLAPLAEGFNLMMNMMFMIMFMSLMMSMVSSMFER